MKDLEELRISIDEIDSSLVELFEMRMNVVEEVAKYKEKNGIPILDTEREKQVIKKNVSKLKNKLLQHDAEEFFQHLMEISRKYQARKVFGSAMVMDVYESKNEDKCLKKLCVGFQGVSGSFSEQALLEYFGENAEKKSITDFEGVFRELENGSIDYGVLPIENSSTGSILDVYDLLRKYEFFITGEKCIDVHQNLLGIKGAHISGITEVYTITTAYEQSREFFKKHRGIKFIPYHNTAASAEYIKNAGDIHKAAVASKMAAKVYGLDILEENINYNKNNRTRFIIIGRDMEISHRCNKISLVFALEHRVGSLNNILNLFAKNDLNLLKIESRPILDKSWQYFFYIDFEGSMEDYRVKEAINLIDKNSFYFKLLGNYEKDV